MPSKETIVEKRFVVSTLITAGRLLYSVTFTLYLAYLFCQLQSKLKCLDFHTK